MIYLYVKTHNETGLKYFGRTYKNPFKYKGSGVYWKAHLKKHGDNVTTEVVGEFDSLELATEFAIKFSKENDIINSPLWANLIEENAIDGYTPGHPSFFTWTEEKRNTWANRTKALWQDPEHRKNVLEKRKATYMKRLETLDPETRDKRIKDKERHEKYQAGIRIQPDNYRYKKPPEFSKKISEALKGRSKSEEVKKKISDTKRTNPRQYSENERLAKSQKMTGRVWIHNNQKSKLVASNLLSEFLNDGWLLGRLFINPNAPNNAG